MRNDFWIRNTKKCSATLSEWISWFILFLQLWYAVVTHLFVTATSYNVTDFFVKTIMLHLLFIMFRGIKMSKKNILGSKIMQVELETVIRHSVEQFIKNLSVRLIFFICISLLGICHDYFSFVRCTLKCITNYIHVKIAQNDKTIKKLTVPCVLIIIIIFQILKLI